MNFFSGSPHCGKHFPAFLLLFSLLSCQSENPCFTSYGPPHESVSFLPSFSSLIIRDDIELRLVPDTLNYAVIQYRKNALSFLHISITGSTLTLENQLKCRWLRDYSVHPVIELHCQTESLRHIIHESIYPLTVQDTFRTDSLLLEIKRSGDVYLPAHIWFLVANLWDTGNLYLTGISAINVINLYSVGEFNGMLATLAYTFIYHYGLRNAYFKAYKGLGLYIYNRGNVYVKGKAWEELIIRRGEGKVFRLRD